MRAGAGWATGETRMSREGDGCTGVTMVHDMGRGPYTEEQAWADFHEAYLPLAEQGRLPLRVLCFLPLSSWSPPSLPSSLCLPLMSSTPPPPCASRQACRGFINVYLGYAGPSPRSKFRWLFPPPCRPCMRVCVLVHTHVGARTYAHAPPDVSRISCLAPSPPSLSFRQT